MTNFTDKLNAGRLYYVKRKNGEIVIRQAHLYSCLRTENAMPFVDFDDNDIEKVMAAVPSYNEVQALKEENARLNKKLEIAVFALKQYATTPTYDWIDSQMVAKKALTQIDEVKK